MTIGFPNQRVPVQSLQSTSKGSQRVSLQRNGLQDRYHTTLAPIAGDGGQRLGTSYLGGCSASYKMQPSKDEANLEEHMHQQRAKKNRQFRWDESKKKPKEECQFQKITVQTVAITTRLIFAMISPFPKVFVPNFKDAAADESTAAL